MTADEWRALLETPALREVLRKFEQGWRQMTGDGGERLTTLREQLIRQLPPGLDPAEARLRLRLEWVKATPSSSESPHAARDAYLIAAWRRGVRPGTTIGWDDFSKEVMAACGVTAVAGKPPRGFGIRTLQRRLDALRRQGLLTETSNVTPIRSRHQRR